MVDHLEKYLQEPAPTIIDDHERLQRNALKELLRLTPDAIEPAVSQIESLYQEHRENAETKFKRAQNKIEARFQDHIESAGQKYNTRLRRIKTEYQNATANLEISTQTKHDQLVNHAELEMHEAEKNYEYEVMLAENVAEATEKRCRQDRRNIQEAVPVAKRRLDELQGQADGIMGLFRQAICEPQDIETPEPVDKDKVIAVFRRQVETAQQHINTLYALKTPHLFIGIRPFFYPFMICAAAVGLTGALSFQTMVSFPPFFVTGPIAFLATLTVVLLIGRAKWRTATTQAQKGYQPIQRIIVEMHLMLDHSLKTTLEKIKELEHEAIVTRDTDIKDAQSKLETTKTGATTQRDTALQELENTNRQTQNELEQHQAQQIQTTENQYRSLLPKLEQEKNDSLAEIKLYFDQQMNTCQKKYDSDRNLLEERWRQGLSQIAAVLEDTSRFDQTVSLDWKDNFWRQWTPKGAFASVVRFGSLKFDINQMAPDVLQFAPFKIEAEKTITLPALLTFPDRCSLLIQTERQGREQAINALRAVMMRLFTSMPAGRVQFTIIDPIGLGENFSGFMHAADHQEALIGGRIWTDAAQIQQQLDDLTGHMENVIQKYLRNEFETIEEYNRQAGELAEPYRFLVIADFPTNFNDESARRLSSIVNSGARCGVYTLIMYDARRELPSDFDIEDLTQKSVFLLNKHDQFDWQDKVFRNFPLQLDTPPDEDVLTEIMHRVGRAGVESSRVEVPFEIIAPAENEMWSLDSSKEICVPVGRTGATRLQHLRLGRGVAQHALLAGKTGSGKSTLLHVIITNLALWYAPDQIELYLIDFKKGVEFKTYVRNKLTHARTIAVESDREFGISVLQRLDAELTRRGDLFRQAGVQDIAAYREVTDAQMPRTVLIVDEFQVFFAEDDKLAQDAAIILEQLVRQGRAFGLHVLLGSQTLAGSANLARSTIGQMAIRIALQCSETDAQLIMDDDNLAARLLTRPGEAIYNDAGGMVVGNSPYQTAWLPDPLRDKYLTKIAELAAQRSTTTEELIVFEGNVPADIADNKKLTECLNQPAPADPAIATHLWLGEPVAIKDPTAAVLRRQSGANLLIVGQRETAALGLISAALTSVAAQNNPNAARFIILDGSPADANTAGFLANACSHLPQDHQIIEWRDVPKIIEELATESQRRLTDDDLKAPAIYLLIYGLQRYRILRRNDDSFSFSMDQDARPQPDKQFAEILREGPPVGVHTVIWSDTLAAVERTLDRQTVREFDNRVLFQMSAADSSNLIDSPVANHLGYHRALFYSDEQGILEKFRPYAPPEKPYLQLLNQTLKNRPNPQ
ncbi:MAG: cell division protein FtsK [Planctomycetes bacterium]|nr:cell division protein FtsK [Planctomycetota bacterium]